MNPDLKEERKLWRRGYKMVVGLDEVGRGPLAGPVVAAAVVIKNLKLKIKNFEGLRDSKKLTSLKREQFYETFRKDNDFEWGIGQISEKTIDKINILEATKLAMQKAVEDLDCKADFLILDGNIKIDSFVPQKSIIRADEKVFSCAAASVIAKVTRDRLMTRLHKKYPRYGFKEHKGYPTKQHIKRLKKHGVCAIHRKSFGPVKKASSLAV